ncbi:MAG: hypothetical protein DRJ10_19630 [Bacteroidetes bacterium]|nr:MAG: hypothetical protein DRJ10_19630 [Bacteroidota bacterium]
MKKFKKLRLFGLLVIALTFTFCESDPETESPTGDFPTSFTVDIPSSISQSVTLKNVGGDDFSGKEIYQHLNGFIKIGENTAELIEDIMKGIKNYGLNKPMDITFTGDDDSREKRIVVINNSDFEGTTWHHQLTMTDVQNEGNEDGGKALQVFWNSNPVKGIAILKPKNWDSSTGSEMENTIFRIGYSEAGENGYDAEMTVAIVGFD